MFKRANAEETMKSQASHEVSGLTMLHKSTSSHESLCAPHHSPQCFQAVGHTQTTT